MSTSWIGLVKNALGWVTVTPIGIRLGRVGTSDKASARRGQERRVKSRLQYRVRTIYVIRYEVSKLLDWSGRL